MGKKKSYIKFNLVKFDKAIAFQIIEQNLRKTPRRINLVFNIDGYQVRFQRDQCPDIQYYEREKMIVIYGRGSSGNHHLKPITIYFEDNFDRDKIFDILVKSFREISKTLNK
ncbi:MAG: hypothetical protein SLAVMIC_00408 [uncultured marine phage]|uniref:Uncharacterized protein n=1 Tax=uncultured marine phage TaxID=707152 RepID=A0A8D9CC67_9VIRU|nr:MAG: hypothetical protein SLAVMIC_00408 [uncultured marine phage]